MTNTQVRFIRRPAAAGGLGGVSPTPVNKAPTRPAPSVAFASSTPTRLEQPALLRSAVGYAKDNQVDLLSLEPFQELGSIRKGSLFRRECS